MSLKKGGGALGERFILYIDMLIFNESKFSTIPPRVKKTLAITCRMISAYADYSRFLLDKGAGLLSNHPQSFSLAFWTERLLDGSLSTCLPLPGQM